MLPIPQLNGLVKSSYQLQWLIISSLLFVVGKWNSLSHKKVANVTGGTVTFICNGIISVIFMFFPSYLSGLESGTFLATFTVQVKCNRCSDGSVTLQCPTNYSIIIFSLIGKLSTA